MKYKPGHKPKYWLCSINTLHSLMLPNVVQSMWQVLALKCMTNPSTDITSTRTRHRLRLRPRSRTRTLTMLWSLLRPDKYTNIIVGVFVFSFRMPGGPFWKVMRLSSNTHAFTHTHPLCSTHWPHTHRYNVVDTHVRL